MKKYIMKSSFYFLTFCQLPFPSWVFVSFLVRSGDALTQGLLAGKSVASVCDLEAQSSTDTVALLLVLGPTVTLFSDATQSHGIVCLSIKIKIVENITL